MSRNQLDEYYTSASSYPIEQPDTTGDPVDFLEEDYDIIMDELSGHVPFSADLFSVPDDASEEAEYHPKRLRSTQPIHPVSDSTVRTTSPSERKRFAVILASVLGVGTHPDPFLQVVDEFLEEGLPGHDWPAEINDGVEEALRKSLGEWAKRHPQEYAQYMRMWETHAPSSMVFIHPPHLVEGSLPAHMQSESK